MAGRWSPPIACTRSFTACPRTPNCSSERLLKESLHELGHTYGLRHCPDYTCVMSSSNAVERIDLKSAEFCPNCAQLIPTDQP